MVERYVFVKLKPEHATDAGRAEVRARSLALRTVPGVRSVVIGAPADPAALSAWDLSLIVRFDSLDDVERYLDDPGHADYYEGFLLERLQVIKAWNFEVQ
jgi:Stress responsive A/B Barrel Domain